VEGISEIPDLMASELLVAFITRRRNGPSAMTQNRIQMIVLTSVLCFREAL